MWEIKNNVIVGNLPDDQRKILNEMGFDDKENLSESFENFLNENKFCLHGELEGTE